MNSSSDRILIPIANPETVEELIELGVMLKADKNTVLYPLTVVNEMCENEQLESFARALLERAEQKALLHNTKAVPLTKNERHKRCKRHLMGSN